MQVTVEKKRETAAHAVCNFEAVAEEWIGKFGGRPEDPARETWLTRP